MGREVRMVPPNWDHPMQEYPSGERYKPMYDRTYEQAATEWMRDMDAFRNSPEEQAEAAKCGAPYFWDWHGNPPDKDYYRPWKDEDATWFQVWETVSEGTPVTPPFATREELVEYLVARGDFWDQRRRAGPWSRKSAEAFVMGGGWAPSGAFMDGQFIESRDVAGHFKSQGEK